MTSETSEKKREKVGVLLHAYSIIPNVRDQNKLCFSMILEGFTLFGLISWNNFILYQMGLYM